MKLGMIVRPEPDQIKKAKDLGLDFVEFDLNYPNWSIIELLVTAHSE